MKVLNFTIIKLTFCLILGILFGFYVAVDWDSVLAMSIISLCVLIIFYCIHKKRDLYHIAFGSVAFITAFFLGCLTTTFHKEKNHFRHYIHHINSNVENTVGFKVFKTLKATAFYERYEVVILKLDNKKVSGKILLNIKKEETAQPLKVDEVYIAKGALKEMLPPLNPHQFNYKKYLENQNIYHQLFIAPQALYKISGKISSIYGMVALWREGITRSLKKHGFKGDELAVINALLLGERQDISEEVYNSYINTGTVHILAVSGWHVGIILIMLNFLLSPLTYFKVGKTAKFIVLVLLLWLFAVIAGLSASAVRAVTMFSFVAWAMYLKRTTNIYNVLAISMFVLLLFKPSFLFDVGFQLSYAAVFSIVWIQPMLYKLWTPRFKGVDFFWKIGTVTLAAQLGVLPISLYYFHQFPGLFFVSNLVIIPVLGIILILGILIVIMAVFDVLPMLLSHLYEQLIKLMNAFISWIAQQEAFLFKDIFFDWKLLVASYLLLIFMILWFKKPVFSRLVYALVSIIVFQSVFIFNKYKMEKTSKFIVFHSSKATIIGEQQGRILHLQGAEAKLFHSKMINNYRVGEGINVIVKEDLKNIYSIHEKALLRIDSLGIYHIPQLNPEYILLCNSPKINLERMIALLKPAVIIADGSNYRSFIAAWKATCKKYNTPFYATGEKGAFIISKP